MNLSQKLKQYRISQIEFERIKEMLGREPQGVEWAIFSALWSEHCSYKSSKVHLKKFASTLTKSAVTSEGENAGVVDLGQGERIVFKMESHNHPSFIEPYQGAATGVGGILRDIFTMGARPIALADYLCFGQPSAPRMGALMDGVVRGISGYGNCVGVPTVTGQTSFDYSYNQNILVNAMAVGLLVSGENLALSGAQGPGNFIVYVGAKTGKDGVHGASMASESFAEDSEAKKPNVQIGDPFYEKLLIESCLEVIQRNLVVAIQDMGAAGLTSSSFEMAAKGGVGMDLHLDQVPIRDSSMQPEDILLSESQERMLLVCEPSRFAEIHAIFAKWGLDSVKIGEVIAQPEIRLHWHGELLAAVDPRSIVDRAPIYERPFHSWKHPARVKERSQLKNIEVNIGEWIKANDRKAFHQQIYRQYDQRVGLMTARGADHDVAIMRLPSGRGLAIAVGCRPFVMRIDAELGALDSIYYPALQMAIKGAQALAATDCLNFGNPERIEIMSEFVASVDAIARASRAMEVSVVSGNVSFYNESRQSLASVDSVTNIVSTPATGLIGIRNDVVSIPEDQFQAAGSTVYLIGKDYILARGRVAMDHGHPPAFAGELEPQSIKDLADKFIEASRFFLSSQMVSGGGLAWSVANMNGKYQLDPAWLRLKTPAELTDDVFYQAIIEVAESRVDEFDSWLSKSSLSAVKLGKTIVGSSQ